MCWKFLKLQDIFHDFFMRKKIFFNVTILFRFFRYFYIENEEIQFFPK